MSEFRDAVVAASDEGFVMAEEGLSELFDALEWLATGGTIYNHPEHEPMYFQIMLAVAWKDVRDYILIREMHEKHEGDSQ